VKSYVRERMPVAVSRTRRGSNEHLSTLGALYCTQLPGGTTQSKIFSCCLYELCSHFLHFLRPTCTRLRIDKKNFDIAVALDSSYEEIRCATHAPVRNASGEGPSECYFKVRLMHREERSSSQKFSGCVLLNVFRKRVGIPLKAENK
jgi:hypothetical protein